MLIASPPSSIPIIILPTSTSLPVIVYVTGAVNNPGIYVLPLGARINDAITASGGFNENADQLHINLASILSDGQQIYVLSQNELDSDPSISALVSTQTTSTSPLIDLNLASRADLESIPGIGTVRATAIIEHRNQHGPFTNIDQLLNITGIGDTILEQISPFLYISAAP
jgi:competence protein ComEA